MELVNVHTSKFLSDGIVFSCLIQKFSFQEVNSLASSLYAPGTSLSRSVSSVGEHQSEAYISPTLPKRAETFGGFDNANKDQIPAAKGMLNQDNHINNIFSTILLIHFFNIALYVLKIINVNCNISRDT
jgi:hypothetical protein